MDTCFCSGIFHFHSIGTLSIFSRFLRVYKWVPCPKRPVCFHRCLSLGISCIIVLASTTAFTLIYPCLCTHRISVLSGTLLKNKLIIPWGYLNRNIRFVELSSELQDMCRFSVANAIHNAIAWYNKLGFSPMAHDRWSPVSKNQI